MEAKETNSEKAEAGIIAARLRYRMAEVGLNAVELAKKAEIRPSFIYDIMHGKSSNPSAVKLARVAEELGIDLSYFLGGERRASSAVISSGWGVNDNDRDFFQIPTVRVESGVDGAIVVVDGAGFASQKFAASWLKDRFCANPADLRTMIIAGDSMEPTLSHSDKIIFDSTKKYPSPPGIYVIFDGFGLVVKRLELVGASAISTVRVISDNPQYSPFEKKLAEIEILGRVVWYAREI